MSDGKLDYNIESVKRQIQQLGPWHYNHVIQGVSTGDSPKEEVHPKLQQLLKAGAFSRPVYKQVLDLGANSGLMGFWFADHKQSQVDAIEYSPTYYPQLEYATKMKGYSDRVNPIYKDIHLGEFGHWKYDLVLFLGTLHHLKPEKYFDILSDIRVSMVPGAEIVVQTSTDIDVENLLKETNFVNIRKLNTNWDNRWAFEAMRNPMKLYDDAETTRTS